jgi:putative Ca2+/H+ antiporter (TMEM165/GDT1 family)
MGGFWASLLLITIAEMGDKTQLVALSLAAKYKPARVMAGIAISTAALFGLAALIGRQVSILIPETPLKLTVGALFIIFGLWTLRGGDDKAEEETKVGRFGPVATIAAAFFLAELGDKTQLTALSLAAQYESWLGVFLGSFLGMMIADGAAVALGTYAGTKLPARAIRIGAAVIFVAFGLFTIITTLL